MEFSHGEAKTHLPYWISRVSFFFSTAALLEGMGNFIWVPLFNKYGRRPAYIASFVLLLASAIWAVLAKSYASELASRIVLGFAAGASECLGPLTIAEIFFLHERGKAVAYGPWHSTSLRSDTNVCVEFMLSVSSVEFPWESFSEALSLCISLGDTHSGLPFLSLL